MDRQRTAVLVHGFLSTGRDMRRLAVTLEAAGYRTAIAVLDTVFGRFDARRHRLEFCEPAKDVGIRSASIHCHFPASGGLGAAAAMYGHFSEQSVNSHLRFIS